MKKMYKVLFILFLPLVTLKQPVQSQSTIGVEVGYGFPWATDEVYDGNIKFLNNGTIAEIETFKTSHGAGRNYSLSFNYPINSLLDGKCFASYLDGTFATKTIESSTGNTNESYKGNMFWISPTLVFNLNKKKISPYAFVGFLVGIAGKITVHRESWSFHRFSESRFIYSQGTAFGVLSGLGLKIRPGKNNKWGVFWEAKIISSSYGPKRGESVKSTIDGVDELSSRPVNEKIFIYKDKYSVDHSIPPVSSEPSVYSRRFYPFSSLGLNIGVFHAL